MSAPVTSHQIEPSSKLAPPSLGATRTWLEQMLFATTCALSLEVAAHRLAVTPRTLQRRLRAEGTSFRGVLRDVRRGLALAALDARRTGAETSDALGFSEPATFYRAFKCWTGVTLKEFVRQRG